MMRCRRARLLSSVVAVAGLALLAVGCGGGGSPGTGVASLGTTTATGPTATTTDSSAPGGELAEYARCMRSHGVLGFPDPASIGSSSGIKAAKSQIAQASARDTSSATFQTAQRACARYDRQAATPPPHPSPQRMRKLLAVSRCMRAHGVESFPDPDPATGEIATPAGISRTSPLVIAALRACSSLGQAAGLGLPTIGP
jgi:hypothetical protein